MERGPGRTGRIEVVREAEERTVGESLKKGESGKKRDGGITKEKNLISRNRKREKGRKPRRKKRGEPGIQATGGGRFWFLCSHYYIVKCGFYKMSQQLTFRLPHESQKRPLNEKILLSQVAWAPVPSPFLMLKIKRKNKTQWACSDWG